MPDPAIFIPGIELSRRLALELEPRLRVFFPDVPITLALFGPGSDVLGFDTSRSMDHDWGPRVTLIVPPDDVTAVRQKFGKLLDDVLPTEIAGFPTRFSFHPDGTAKVNAQGNEHRVRISSVSELLDSSLLIDSPDDMSDAVWLSTPMQTLLELIAGEVFVDDTGEFTELRIKLAFYPDHIWRYQLAGFWMRIAQVQPFVGRCFEMEDRTGAAEIALGIIRDIMRIGLLQSRKYAPYAKWLGTTFSSSEIGGRILPFFNDATAYIAEFPRFEQAINAAGGEIIRQLNDLELIAEVDPAPHQFWDRPFQVLPTEQIALNLKRSVDGTGLERIDRALGGIDVISDSTDALGSREFRLAVREMFDPR